MINYMYCYCFLFLLPLFLQGSPEFFGCYADATLEVLTYGDVHDDKQNARSFLDTQLKARTAAPSPTHVEMLIEDLATEPELASIVSTGFLQGLTRHLDQFSSDTLRIENIEKRKVIALALYAFYPVNPICPKK